MLNLSELTSYYIETKFIDEMKVLLLDAFSLMEAFGMNFYEDKYIDLINSTERVASDEMNTQFIRHVVQDLNLIISSHGLTLDEDTDILLAERLDICHGLLILANLEDYDFVKYRVNTDQPFKTTIIDLLERYTTLSRFRCMEIISDVEESLITTLRELSDKQEPNDSEQLDKDHKKYIDRFFSYIEKTDCLAKQLMEKGYDSTNTLEELVNLQSFDMVDYIVKQVNGNFPQAVLDIFSLLVYTYDDYTLPVFKFKKHSHLFTVDVDLTARIHNTLFSMINDFSLYLKACEEGERVNVN